MTGLGRFARERGLTRIEATSAGIAEWADHVKALGEGLLMNEIASWMTGVNRSVEGQAGPQDHALQRWPTRLSRALRRVLADRYRKLALA